MLHFLLGTTVPEQRPQALACHKCRKGSVVLPVVIPGSAYHKELICPSCGVYIRGVAEHQSLYSTGIREEDIGVTLIASATPAIPNSLTTTDVAVQKVYCDVVKSRDATAVKTFPEIKPDNVFKAGVDPMLLSSVAFVVHRSDLTEEELRLFDGADVEERMQTVAHFMHTRWMAHQHQAKCDPRLVVHSDPKSESMICRFVPIEFTNSEYSQFIGATNREECLRHLLMARHAGRLITSLKMSRGAKVVADLDIEIRQTLSASEYEQFEQSMNKVEALLWVIRNREAAQLAVDSVESKTVLDTVVSKLETLEKAVSGWEAVSGSNEPSPASMNPEDIFEQALKQLSPVWIFHAFYWLAEQRDKCPTLSLLNDGTVTLNCNCGNGSATLPGLVRDPTMLGHMYCPYCTRVIIPLASNSEAYRQATYGELLQYLLWLQWGGFDNDDIMAYSGRPKMDMTIKDLCNVLRVDRQKKDGVIAHLVATPRKEKEVARKKIQSVIGPI